MIHVAMLSGGQDSSCMVVKMLEEGMKLDYIVFTDTGKEFKAMYKYLDDLDAYIKRKFNISITRIGKPEKFDEFCFGEFTKGERVGEVRGLPMTLGMQYCTRELKVVPFEKWAKQFDEVTLYIGYTYSELKRADVQDQRQKFPLIDFKMTEKDVTEFLQERKIWNPLYKHFTRTGCFLCPKQKKEAFYKLWKHYPEEWAEMKEYEEKCKQANAYNQTFNIDKTLIELEKEFKVLDRQQGFVFEEDPMLSCFCGV